MTNQDVTGSATTMLPVSTRSATSKTPRKTRQSHGFTGQIKGRYTADRSQIDGRSALGQAVAAYRADLLASLGGAESLSAQELTLVEMCAKDWLILQSVDAYLLQAGLFNKKKRAAYPLTATRMQIADSLTRRLQALGLTKRAKPTRTLSELLQKGEAA